MNKYMPEYLEAHPSRQRADLMRAIWCMVVLIAVLITTNLYAVKRLEQAREIIAQYERITAK